MAGQGIQLEGADTFRRTLAQAGRDLADLDAENATVSRLVAGAARGLAPRRTGTLAGSISGDGDRATATVTATAGHARPIHAGVPSRGITARPFLTDAVDQTETRWVAVYRGAITDAVRKVRGA